MARAKSLKTGGSDGARTRDLRRDRPTIYLAISTTVPTFSVLEWAAFRAEVGTLFNGSPDTAGNLWGLPDESKKRDVLALLGQGIGFGTWARAALGRFVLLSVGIHRR
jgi:hypothetical protein